MFTIESPPLASEILVESAVDSSCQRSGLRLTYLKSLIEVLLQVLDTLNAH